MIYDEIDSSSEGGSSSPHSDSGSDAASEMVASSPALSSPTQPPGVTPVRQESPFRQPSPPRREAGAINPPLQQADDPPRQQEAVNDPPRRQAPDAPPRQEAGQDPPTLQERVRAESEKKLRDQLRHQLYSDNLEDGQDEEEAAANADWELETAFQKKKEHRHRARQFREAATDYRREVAEIQIHVTALSDLLASTTEGGQKPSESDLNKARLLRQKASIGIKPLIKNEKEVVKLGVKAIKAFYRPVASDQQTKKILGDVKSESMALHAAYQVAYKALNRVLDPPKPAPSTSGSQSSDTMTAAAVVSLAAEVAKKKICIRDFKIDRYVDPFSGEDTDALAQYAKWRAQWNHGIKKMKEVCEEEDDKDAVLHLLRSTLTGAASRIASSALTEEAALAALEDKFDDIVGLVESYLPPPAPPGETRSSTVETTAAKRFAQRWPRVRDQLKTSGVDLDDFNGIRIQLAGFGGNAASKWRTYVKAELRRKPDGTGLGEVYNWTEFSKWLDEKDDEADAREKSGEENSSAGIFAVSACAASSGEFQAAAPTTGCLLCGPGVPHRSATCRKVADMENEDFYAMCKEKNWCKRCVQSTWSPAHNKQCQASCGDCGRLHLTSRHHRAVAAVKEKKKTETSSSSTNRKKRDNSSGSRDGKGRNAKRHRAEASREPPRSDPIESRLERLEKLERAASASQQQQKGANKGKASWKAAKGKNGGRGKESKNEKKD